MIDVEKFNMANVSLCVPILKPGKSWENWLKTLRKQTVSLQKILVINSGSNVEDLQLAKKYGCHVFNIEKKDFNHGGTRQMAVELLFDADIIVFLTQDAILAKPDSISQLIKAFDDLSVGAAYGRQLPLIDADPIESHARIFNYPDKSQVVDQENIHNLGIKAAFLSNSFAAYRRSVLVEVGGFPSNIILGEDTFVAGKMLLRGWKKAYCARATVYHSHNYGILEEFNRYFDIGIFHAREPWIQQRFGSAGGEGMRYMISEFAFLLQKKCFLIPVAVLRNALKFLGYKLGLMETKIPHRIKRSLSMHKSYWSLKIN